MLPAKIYTVVAPANGMVELAVVGDFFKVLSAGGAFVVTGDTFGPLGAILAGQGLRDAEFSRLQFTDTSGAQNTISVLVAGQSFIDDRVTGDVSVIDTVVSSSQHAYGNAGVAVGTVVTQVVAASSVITGRLLVRGLDLWCGTGTGGACNVELALMAAAAAPASLASGAGRILLAHAFASTGTATPAVDKYAEFKMSRLLPTGWNIYLIETAGTLAGAKVYSVETQAG